MASPFDSSHAPTNSHALIMVADLHRCLITAEQFAKGGRFLSRRKVPRRES